MCPEGKREEIRQVFRGLEVSEGERRVLEGGEY